MKKLILISALLAIVSVSYSQERLVLIEQFTGASCIACAYPPNNPRIEELMSENSDKAVSLIYQSDLIGYDPMYDDYPAGVNSRSSYYFDNFNSVPNFVNDGNFEGPLGLADLTQSDIDTRAAVPSPFNINLSYTKTSDQIDVSMNITAVAAVSGNLKARIAVIEDRIAFDEAPGSNGEKYFFKVLKRFLPSPLGTTLASDWNVDDTQSINESWVFQNVYDTKEIAVIAFIQDDLTKEIHQVAFARPEVIHPFDIKVTAATEIPTSVNTCSPEAIAPRLTVVNNGSTAITSFDLEYDINNEQTLNYNWTGNLSDPADYTIIHLPEMIVNQFDESNEFTAVVRNINGNETDDNPVNNTLNEGFNAYLRVTNGFQIRFRSGSYGTNFRWRIVAEGSTSLPSEYSNTLNYSYNGTDTNTIDIDLPSDCWMFKIYKGGGVNPVSNFFFELIDNGNVVYSTNTIPNYTDIPFFVDENNVSIPEYTPELEFYLTPNPANDIVTVNTRGIKDHRIRIYNSNGVCVYKNQFYSNQMDIDLSSLSSGIYFVNIIGEDISKVKKLLLN